MPLNAGQGGGNARSFDIDSKDQQLTRGNKALVHTY